jgi:hypothetical protein
MAGVNVSRVFGLNAAGVLGWYDASGLGGGGFGSVTSVALAVPAALGTVSGSPVTGSGTLTFSLSTQTANTVFAGPTAGGAAIPGFRALVAADLPAGAYAPVGAQYVTLATDATLTGERVLTVTAREIDLTDGGAGGAATLRVAQGLRGAARAYLARHFR